MTAPAPGRKSSSRGLAATDLGFRLGTGVFAAVLVLIVVAIGFELSRQSMLSIQKFGLNFWRTDVWDPVAGQFGALPFIWGTLYSSILALVISTPIALGIAVFISELCPDWLKQPLVFLTELLAAIPSIVYGLWGIFVLVPAVRALESSLPAALAPAAAVQRSAARRRHALGGADPRGHGRPVLLVGGARGAEVGARRAARRRLRARRDALRGDPRGAVLRPHRHRRRGHARLRPRPRRDHGGDDGDRQHPEGLGLAVRAAGHHGRRAGQPVHRGRHRALPERAGRDRPRAVHHHADRQQPVAAADLEHGAQRAKARAPSSRRNRSR